MRRGTCKKCGRTSQWLDEKGKCPKCTTGATGTGIHPVYQKTYKKRIKI